MFDAKNIISLIILRFKILRSEFDIKNIKFFLAITSLLFASLFLLIAFGGILSVSTRFYLGLTLLIPFLSNTLLSQRALNSDSASESRDNSYKLFSFLKILPIKVFDRALYGLISESILSFKFWYGLGISFTAWLIFCKLKITLLLLGIIFYLLAYFFTCVVFNFIYLLYVNQSKVLRFSGHLINIFINIVGIFIFFNLYSFLGREISSNNFLLRFLINTSFTNLSIFTLLLSGALGLGAFAFISFLQKIIANKYLYFVEFGVDKQKTKAKRLKQKSESNQKYFYFINGVITKNLKWLSKFPSLLFSLIYPLFFIVIASKFVFPYLGIGDSEGFRNLYLVLSLGTFTLLADNQLSVYSKYFLFDLKYNIRIREYFLFKFLLFFSILCLVIVAFYLSNIYLDLGFRLNINSFFVLLIYFFLMQIKGVLLSLFDYKPMVYIENTLKNSSPNIVSNCMVSIVNYFLLGIFYILLVLNVPTIILIGLNMFILTIYVILIYISKFIFEDKYFDILEKAFNA